MRIVSFLVGLLAAAAAQVLGLRLFPSFLVATDLLLVLAVYNALDRGPVGSMVGGSVAGLAQDALTGGLFGLHGFADTLVSWGSSSLRQRLVIQKPTQVALLFVLAAAAQQVILALLSFLMVPGSELPGPGTMAARMGTTAAVGTLVFVLSGRIRQGLQTWRSSRRSRLRLGVD